MDQYFERIQQLLSRSDFPVRIRFMIEDVIDLRSAKVALNVCNTETHNTEYSWSLTANIYLLFVGNNSIWHSLFIVSHQNSFSQILWSLFIFYTLH